MTGEKCLPRCIGIAIVEDEKALIDIYRRVFARNNIAICFVAFDGREAVEKFLGCVPKPRVILMDYRLPTMNGIDATREILKIDPDARIIFLSADIAAQQEALRAGAKEFLKKPASLKDILQAVRKHLANGQVVA